MSNKKKNNYRLDSPIYLDYDVEKVSGKIITHNIMSKTIKEYFQKHGFENKGKTDNRTTILVKKKSEKNDGR